MTNAATYGHVLRHPREELTRSLEGASKIPFWLDGPRPAASPSLRGDHNADLVVIGGGFCGLWTALQAKERDPDRDVVLIEAKRIAWAASGRNGGFVEASLTHGVDNGVRHFGPELDAIGAIAKENFDGLRSTLLRYGIDAEWEEHGVLTLATEPHQVDDLAASGEPFLVGDALLEVTKSPVALAGTMESEDVALLHPAKLAFGLLRACLSLGVRVFEGSPALGISDEGDRVTVLTRDGTITATKVALATNGFRSLLKRNALLTVPVYDYVLVTEPLTDDQLNGIGWVERFGMTDSSRQFHYYRKTADNRILWGGYDAVYHRGRKIRTKFDQRPETFERLADHFFTTFPTLRGIEFTHAWGGMIDMSTNFVPFQGLAMKGKVTYSLGYTGLGVAATRFGAAVMLDLLAGEPTPRTALKFSTTRPFPIPPEPIAYPAIQTMRNAISRSDENGGKDGLLIRALEIFGIGFDS
jgi:glycine/D-amino acid oxidase-like deaminating enzyme